VGVDLIKLLGGGGGGGGGVVKWGVWVPNPQDSKGKGKKQTIGRGFHC